MDKDHTFPHEDDFNRKLTKNILTLSDLTIYIRFRYGNYRSAAREANISLGRVKQICIGYSLPKTSKLINKIAKGWEIDPVTLTLLFDRERRDNGE